VLGAGRVLAAAAGASAAKVYAAAWMAPQNGVPPPVRTRRLWFVCATTAVSGTIAAAVLPSPWSIVCGALAALGAIGAFVMFVAIVVLEDREQR
jgi:hypothetical protein